MKKHFNIRVSGEVQGVFFRASTKQKADELAISGFARNEPDGSVYVEAEGNEEALKALIDWCSRGPVSARVEKCEAREDIVRNFTRFTIER